MATAEAATEDEGEAAAPAKGKRIFGLPKLAVFVGAPLLLLAIVAGGLYFTGVLGSLFGSAPQTAANAPPPDAPHDPVFFDVPDMLVNLNAGNRRSNYLKLTISLALESKDDVPKVQALMPRVIDTCQDYLRELRLEDLRGSAGLYRLREELQARIGAAVAPVKVDEVLFKDILVQ